MKRQSNSPNSFTKLIINQQKTIKYQIVYQFCFTTILVLYFGLILAFYLETLDGFAPRFVFFQTKPIHTINFCRLDEKKALSKKNTDAFLYPFTCRINKLLFFM